MPRTVSIKQLRSRLNEKFAQINKIDQAIFEAEYEVEEGAKPVPLNVAKNRLDEKYYG